MCQFFRSYRKKNNLTQVQLSQLLGCTQGTVAHIENGRRQMSYDNARDWGELLGVDPRLLRPSPYPEYFDDNQKAAVLP